MDEYHIVFQFQKPFNIKALNFSFHPKSKDEQKDEQYYCNYEQYYCNYEPLELAEESTAQSI